MTVLRQRRLADWMQTHLSDYARTQLRAAEDYEPWVRFERGSPFERSLVKLAGALEEKEDPNLEDDIQKSLYYLFSFVGIRRFVRLIDLLERRDIRLTSRDQLPADDAVRSVLVQRMMHLAKLRTYERLFGPGRREQILNLLSQAIQEGQG